MIAYGQGDIPMALEHIAAARSVAEGDFEQAALDTLYAQVLAGSGSDESDRATAQALDHLAALSETGGAETEGAVVRSVQTLAGIELRNDHITQALDIYESGLRMLAPDSHANLDIALLAADVEARCRRPGASLERLHRCSRGAGERTDWLRLELVRARAELAAGRPAEAIRITSGVLRSAQPGRSRSRAPDSTRSSSRPWPARSAATPSRCRCSIPEHSMTSIEPARYGVPATTPRGSGGRWSRRQRSSSGVAAT